MAPVKTLRARPLNAFSQYHRTPDFLQSQVQPYGQTCGLKRSLNKNDDYFDIEFVTRQDAQLALRKCKITNVDIIWAPRNIYRKKRKGRCIASYKSPLCDYDNYSEEPSLPVPTNNPNITKWVLPKRKKPDYEQKPAVRYDPRRTQPPPGPNPCGPFVTEVWPEPYKY